MRGVKLIKSSIDSAADLKVKEEVSRIQQDYNVIAQKIVDVGSDSGADPPRSESPSVSSLRSSFSDSEKRMKEPKLYHLETLLDKICELDRLILKKTAPVIEQGSQLRRKSLGSDLFTLPTHLHLIDRLLDLHTQSKRVTVIKTTVGGNSSNEVAKIPLPAGADKKQIEQLQANILQLNQKLEKSDASRKQLDKENTELKGELEILKSNAQHEKVDAAPPVSAQVVDQSAEVKLLQSNMALLQMQIASLHNQLELEINNNQAILAVIHGKIARLNDGKNLAKPTDDCDHVVSVNFAVIYC